ncbi:MAG TPA: peptide chain release factor 1 [Kiritimatiellia bacterium]|nr:peptide chain release factor 1 [Kiritimatiellia bacterium]
MIDPSTIDKLTARLAVLEGELSDPVTAANQKKYRALIAEHLNLQGVRGKADAYFRLAREREEAQAMVAGGDAELREMAQAELARIDAELPAAEQALKVSLLPPDPDDSRNTIVEIRAGTGGDEAAIFAGDLFRMYSRFADARGWRVGVIDASPSELGGYKEIVFTVEGDSVYRVLRYESGGHRVQRVPETEAQGRIHTSAATVAVLPEAEETDEVIIKPEDIRIDLYRASGAGGQKVNKTESAVRITHLPTGVVVQCQDERSQHKNKDRAMKVLAARLLDKVRSDEQAKQASDRKSQVGSGDRSERIRTYNFPQNRVTDHRINLTLYNLDRVIEGEMDALVDALYQRDVELKLQKHLGV